MTELVAGEVVERRTLQENEAILERRLTSFIEFGRALLEIRDERQYADAGFDSFEDYCRERWDLGPASSYDYVAAAGVSSVLETHGLPAPPTLRAALPLVRLSNDLGRYDPKTHRLRQPDVAEREVVSAWQKVIARHQERHETPDAVMITRRDVMNVVYPKATSNIAGWHELLGDVGNSLITSEKRMAKVEKAITKDPGKDLRAKALEYADRADALAARLRTLGEI